MSNHKFPKTIRLVQQFEFDRVHGGDVFAADETLVIKAVDNSLNRTRMGLSIGKKVGNAVCRNRWKRLIREAFRKRKSQFPAGIDIVVRPRKGAKCDYQAIDAALVKLVKQVERRLNRKRNSR